MFHVYWPASAALTMFVLCCVIFMMLRYGPRICKTRHVTLPDDKEWEEKAYEQKVSYA